MNENFSYYDILGVTSTATDIEIKSAYRSAMAKYHPDVNTEANAQVLAQMINNAYNTLRDPSRRANYDSSQRKLRFDGEDGVTEASKSTQHTTRRGLIDECLAPSGRITLLQQDQVCNTAFQTIISKFTSGTAARSHGIDFLQDVIFSKMEMLEVLAKKTGPANLSPEDLLSLQRVTMEHYIVD